MRAKRCPGDGFVAGAFLVSSNRHTRAQHGLNEDVRRLDVAVDKSHLLRSVGGIRNLNSHATAAARLDEGAIYRRLCCCMGGRAARKFCWQATPAERMRANSGLLRSPARRGSESIAG